MRIILSALLLILTQSIGAQVTSENVLAGCTVPIACNYDPDANANDGSCDFTSCQGCTNACACNYDEENTLEDGSCEYETCGALLGCTVPMACNFDLCATTNDGSCDFFSCIVFGCNNPAACNYDPDVTFNDGSCDFVSCIPAGCTIEDACNYDPEAELNDGSCEFSSCAGCTDECASNYDATATIDNGSCDPVLGCTNSGACNYDPCADTNDGSCDYLSCQIVGCLDLTACNFNADATISDGSCVYAELYYDCEGNCINPSVSGCVYLEGHPLAGEPICEENVNLGCTDPEALAYSYDPFANCDDGSCEYAALGCTNPLACNFDINAAADDGSCEFVSCAGCLVASACNFEPMALIANNELCEFPEEYYDCDGNCLLDGDGDGVCDQLEIVGCHDEAACNYNPEATDSGFCSYPIDNFDCDGNSLRPIFTAFPANVDVDACNVPSWEDALVEAIVSPFSPSFEATYNDNDCYETDMDVVVAFAGEVLLHGDCENNYVLVRSWSATDCAGYTRTREQILNVSDTTAPSLEIPEDQTISCDMVEGADFGMATATDDCGEAMVSLDTDIVEGDCEGQYSIVRTFTASDLCGNETVASQTIQVVDETAPVMEALADLVLDCTDALSDELPAATDNCSDVAVSVSDEVIAGDCPQEYTVVRTFTAVDECGNTETMVQNVTFVDDEAPVVVSGFSSEVIYVNNLDGETVPAAELVVEDNCDAEATWSSSDAVVAESAAAQTIVRTYTISDACGNELVLEETIEVTLINPGCTDDVACNYDADANLDDESCDYCSCGQNACGCTDPGACNYDDANEYEDGSCTYPENDCVDCDGVCIDTNGNGICDCDESGCMDPTACNYDEDAFLDDGSCDYCSCDYTDIDGYEANTSSVDGYNVVVELAQTHLEGVLEGMHTYRVYIETPSSEDVVSALSGDEEFALEINTTTSFYQSPFGAAAGGNISPAMIVVAPDAEWDSYVTIGATTSADNPGGLVSTIGVDPWENVFEAGNSFAISDPIGGGWFLAPPSQDNAIAGDDNRVLVAQLTTDGVVSGQFAAQIFPGGHFPGADDIRPEFTFQQRPVGAFACPTIDVAPEDETVSCDTDIYLPTGEDFAVSYDFSAADAIGCEGPLTVVDVVDEIEAGSCTGNYTVTRNMEIENCAGQSAFHTYVITVQDITAPVFTSFPEDYTVECSDDMPMEGAEASDNCGPVTIDLVTDTAFTEALGNYIITREFTATDDCGNATTQVQTITVQDTTAPELVIPADYIVECSDEKPMEDAVIADNCGDMVLVLEQDTILTDALGNYTITRIFTVTDDAGNSTTATQTITVQDTTNPEFTYVPADVTIECSDADLDAVLTEASMASDNCGEFSIVEDTVVDETDAVGNYTVTRTFTVTDDAGNSSVAVQVIVVQDTTAPVLTIPSDYTTECSEEIVYDEASTTDNCGPVVLEEVSRVRVDGDCVGSFQMVRTFTATDDAGNATTLVQTITVEDTTAPELTIPESYTVECSDELILDDALAVDNCSSCATEFDFSSSVEGYGMSLELVAEHLDGDLAGMETYRVYLDLAAASDVVTSISGSEEFALELNTTTSFYQHPLGAATPSMLSDMALDAVPALAFDSYITLGVDGPAGAGEQDASFIPTIPGGAIGSWPEEFEAGNNLVINSALGSGWYVTPDASNGVAGDDQRILIAQLTTDGDLSGQFRTQVFPEGDQDNDVRADLSFEHERDCSDLPVVLVEEVTNFVDDWNYTLERTFTATDDCGNSTTATQIIVVEDTTAPELWAPADYTAECSDDIPQVAAEYSDNCSEVDFTETVEIIDVECVGTYKIRRSFLAVDQSGNSTSAVQVITVQDTTDPVLTLPEDYTVECSDEMPMEDAYAYDNCQVCDDAFDHTSTEEGVGLSLEFVQAHHEGDLAGMETYRVYLEASEGDVLTSLSGNDEFALELNTTTSFYQHVMGGATPSDINSAMLDVVPELAFDSYVTVGLTQAPGVGEEAADLMPGSWESAFETGSSISVNDDLGSGWYTLPSASNGIIDESGRILVAQLTTDGDISGQFRAQLFPGGDQVNDVRADLSFEHARTCSDLTIDLVTEIVPGNAAGNYTIERTFTATDDCGNETVGTQVITVEDTTAPEFTVVPEDYTVECSDEMPMEDAFAVDACQVCEDAFDVESSVDGVGLSLELVQAHAYGELAGMETYRVYLDVAEGDVLTSLSGNDEFALELNTTTSFYQHALGGATPSDINGAMLDMIPELAFDSYVTVGLTQAPEMGEEAADLMPGSWDDAFEAGSSIAVNNGLGSGWYTLPFADNGTAGASGRILVAQLTTDGDISGQFRAQIFPGGDQVNDVRADLSFVHARTCSELTIDVVQVTTPGDATGNYTITRTFTATDDAGNSSQAEQVITVEDTTAPEFTFVPGDLTIECSAEELEAVLSENATAVDNCGPVVVEYVNEFSLTDALGNYTVTRTFTATDDAGNFSTAVQVVNVEDTTAPEFTFVPGDLTIECSAEELEAVLSENATAGDLCGPVVVEYVNEYSLTDALGNYTVTRTFTATDDAGNFSTAVQIVNVQDTTAPVLTIPADYTVECSDEIVFDEASATDNCGEIVIDLIEVINPGNATGNYTIVRTFTATDDAGNATTLTQTITVQDTTSPDFLTIPEDLTIECSDEDLEAVLSENAIAGDLCGPVVVEYVNEFSLTDALGNYTVTRTFTATDDAGNFSTAVQVVTVEDTTAPEFTFVPGDLTIECSAEELEAVLSENATAGDLCGPVVVEYVNEFSLTDALGNYTVTRTFTATDDAGNFSTVVQVVNVQDTTAPILTIPADYTVECSDEMPMEEASATDNCGNFEITLVQETTSVEGSGLGEYTITRTFTVTDDAGNSTTDVQTITVIDTTAPEFTFVPEDYTVECSDEMPMLDATASDNCGEVVVEVVREDIPGDAAGNYTILRTFTATDDAGNLTSVIQTITVEDTTAPVLTIPADYTVECSDEIVFDEASATDNCGEIVIDLIEVINPGNATGNYTITRTFTATDDAGNSSQAEQVITVEDTTAPEFTFVPGDLTIECSAEELEAVLSENATAVDNCGPVVVEYVNEFSLTDALGNYTVTRTFTATDDAGNFSTAIQVVTVEDNTAPEFIFVPGDLTIECSADELEAVLSENATAGDLCGPVVVEYVNEFSLTDALGNYTVTRTFTATDDAGNFSTAVQVVNVADTTPPEFMFVPGDLTIECSAEDLEAVLSENAIAGDLCGPVVVEYVNEYSLTDALGNYTVTRTFTATDDAGNSSTAVQIVTVEDTTAPVLTIPADYTVECSDEMPMEDASATDNCGNLEITLVTETIPGNAAGDYTILRTFTATDDANNATTLTQTITVQDTTAPVLTIPADYTAECTDELVYDDASATDNCGSIEIVLVEEIVAGDCPQEYTVLRTFTATDDAGNATTLTQTITVVDTTAPELFVPPSYEADCGDELVLLDGLATDLCGAAAVIVEESYDYTCATSYVLTRTFTGIDLCGNTTVGTQTITVTDTTAPEFTSIPEDYTAECSEELDLSMPTATDNCDDVNIAVEEEMIAGECANEYTLIRTFTASDDCGNASVSSQTITVQDTTAPEFTSVPGDETTEFGMEVSDEMATAVDNCGDVTVTVSEETVMGDCEGDFEVTRTFTAVDACGNASVAVQTVTVEDTTAPALTVGADVTIECDEEIPAEEFTVSDLNEVDVDVTEEIIAGDCPQAMTIERTYTATDACGNSTSLTQTIEIVDTTAPIFTYTPPAQTTNYAAEGDTLSTPFAIVVDNCDENAGYTVEETILVNTASEFTVERLYTAFDACGNTSTVTQTATLISIVFGCTDPESCNYEEDANANDGSCTYPDLYYDCEGNCNNPSGYAYLPGHPLEGQVICLELMVEGCLDDANPAYNNNANVPDEDACLILGCTIDYACNYNNEAEYSDGSCEFESCLGCMNENACNYDPEATLQDDNCEYPPIFYDCDGNCNNPSGYTDADGEIICEELVVAGCTDPLNPSYNPDANVSVEEDCLVGGCLLPYACNYDPTAEYLLIETCDFDSCAGCTDLEACNYEEEATLSNPQACDYAIDFYPSGFYDCDGDCNNPSSHVYPAGHALAGEVICEELVVEGCTDPSAANYNPFANVDNGTCVIYTYGCVLPWACNYNPDADVYLPGSCDFSCLGGMPVDGEACADEMACNYGVEGPCVYFTPDGGLCALTGCTDEAACDYDAEALVNTGCDYYSCAVFGCTNDAACNFEVAATLDNGTCDFTTCMGCTDAAALNYDADATSDSGQCQYSVPGCTLMIACNYDADANVNDGSCDFNTCFGCVAEDACNYDATALYPDGDCDFAATGMDCDGNCLGDVDGDGVCDANEVEGCTDVTALNFNVNATDDSGDCTYLVMGCVDQMACNFDYAADQDNGSCEYDSCSGCVVSWACNYDAEATYHDGSCIFPDVNGVCPNACESDFDGDGICDADEVSGCTYFNAANFNPAATDDDGTCQFVGCTDADFTSYNDLANVNSGDCTNAPASADFTGDGQVQLEDLLDFLVAYGTSGPEWGIDWVQDGCSVEAMGVADLGVSASGCTYTTATNYDPTSSFDEGTCVWLGCTDSEALNFNSLATLDDASCSYHVCPDFNGDGQVQAEDLLDFLVAWGSIYE